MQFDNKGEHCIVAVDGSDGPSFHSVAFDSDADMHQTISLLSGSSKQKKKRKQPDQQTTPEKPSPAAAAGNGKMKNIQELSMGSPKAKDSTPLEVRVSQMGITNRDKEGSFPKPGVQRKLQQLDGTVAAGEPSKGRHLTANSATVLLSQALQSSDKQLLEQCLQVRQEQVISNTIKQLRSDQVGKLVPLLVERINSSSTRAMQVACWIRHVLRHHLTYIISAPSMKTHLSVLYQHLEERQSSYNALLGLQGRLELLTTHIKSMRQRQANMQDGASNGTSEEHYDYYNDPVVLHLHEDDDVETISIVPQIELEESDDDDDEHMKDAASESE